MMLGDPGRIESGLLGMNYLLGREAVALCGTRLIENPGEEAEPSWPGASVH
jgi:hypothetical protein